MEEWKEAPAPHIAPGAEAGRRAEAAGSARARPAAPIPQIGPGSAPVGDPLADEAARDGVFKIYSIPVSWFARVANIPAKQQVDACDTVNLEDARTRVFTILQRVDGVHGFLTRR